MVVNQRGETVLIGSSTILVMPKPEASERANAWNAAS
jgi:hypothetical protein